MLPLTVVPVLVVVKIAPLTCAKAGALLRPVARSRTAQAPNTFIRFMVSSPLGTEGVKTLAAKQRAVAAAVLYLALAPTAVSAQTLPEGQRHREPFCPLRSAHRNFALNFGGPFLPR